MVGFYARSVECSLEIGPIQGLELNSGRGLGYDRRTFSLVDVKPEKEDLVEQGRPLGSGVSRGSGCAFLVASY